LRGTAALALRGAERKALFRAVVAARRGFATLGRLVPAAALDDGLRVLPRFRATAFRAAGRLLTVAVFFFAVLRPLFAPGAALRLAIAVVLSVVTYLDCFR
jgi:hypothetical protein